MLQQPTVSPKIRRGKGEARGIIPGRGPPEHMVTKKDLAGVKGQGDQDSADPFKNPVPAAAFMKESG